MRTDEAMPIQFDEQIFNDFLAESEVGLRFDDAFHFLLVGFFVGLGARAVHRGAFAAVEQAELDAGGIDGLAHGAAEGVDFANDLSLGDAADGWVTAHLRDGVAVGGEQRGACSHARCGECGFATGMTGADNEHVEVVSGGHGRESEG